jgi:hypothetical protein
VGRHFLPAARAFSIKTRRWPYVFGFTWSDLHHQQQEGQPRPNLTKGEQLVDIQMVRELPHEARSDAQIHVIELVIEPVIDIVFWRVPDARVFLGARSRRLSIVHIDVGARPIPTTLAASPPSFVRG